MSEFAYEYLVADIPDYPEPGVIFKDITPLLSDKDGFTAYVKGIADHFRDSGVTKVVGAEARGFLIGAPVAYELGAGFVPARKPGKLPREVYSQDYALEYGTDTIQIHKDAIEPGERILIIDDLVATGGTCVATAKLVEKAGGEILGFGFIMELAFLNPRETIGEAYPDVDFFSLFSVE